MAFSVQSCAIEGCGQLLYVLLESGEQRVFCAKCGGVTLFNLRSEIQGEDGPEE